MYALAWPNTGVGRIARTRWEGNGNSNPSSIGTGGIQLQGHTVTGAAAPTVFEIDGSEWYGNTAGTGAALFIALGQGDVRLRQCLFRCARLRYRNRLHAPWS
eukprot:COSAG04_NODE_24849_length_316_cov_0.663594_1_plen_102_part_01